jgi:hypothetical protein
MVTLPSRAGAEAPVTRTPRLKKRSLMLRIVAEMTSRLKLMSRDLALVFFAEGVAYAQGFFRTYRCIIGATRESTAHGA